MCVTNTTQGRVRAVSLTPAQSTVTPSILSQRLFGTFAGQGPLSGFPSMPSTGAYVNTVPLNKSRPKRRRKPQKPGKTAKLNDRHFVVHNYHDHASDADQHEEEVGDSTGRRRGGVAVAFPVKLHSVLGQVEMDGLSHVVSWQPHGRCFVIHKPKEFVDHVMPKYFRQTKLTSFQRQLNLYGFQRLTRGGDAGGYYHECFLRGREFLCKKMNRTKVKGTRFKAASSPEQEPDFYTMPGVPVTPPTSSDEEMSFDSSRSPMHMLQAADYGNLDVAVPVNVASAAHGISLLQNLQRAPMRQNDADYVLDQAVDELFLGEVGESDNLADFVHDWDPSFGQVMEDDAQLGFMLDKLLED
jgi:hypothetical protein